MKSEKNGRRAKDLFNWVAYMKGVSLPNRFVGSCLILVNFKVILLSLITLKICVVDKSTPLYVSFNFSVNSCNVIVLFFLISSNKNFTYSFLTL